ncbi:hypothetical protein L7F22_036872 [Adiantum nelumboides]|nr:hypothetical protein [Adiantum nelumboides]
MVPEEQPEVEELDEILVLEQILAHKDRKVRGKVARRFLVKFKNYSPMDAKWIEEAELILLKIVNKTKLILDEAVRANAQAVKDWKAKDMTTRLELHLNMQNDQKQAVRTLTTAKQLEDPYEHKAVSIQVLFCSTEAGRSSFVRQLEPDWHVDTSLETISQLARFIRHELHISPVGTSRAAPNDFWFETAGLVSFIVQDRDNIPDLWLDNLRTDSGSGLSLVHWLDSGQGLISVTGLVTGQCRFWLVSSRQCRLVSGSGPDSELVTSSGFLVTGHSSREEISLLVGADMLMHSQVVPDEDAFGAEVAVKDRNPDNKGKTTLNKVGVLPSASSGSETKPVVQVNVLTRAQAKDLKKGKPMEENAIIRVPTENGSLSVRTQCKPWKAKRDRMKARKAKSQTAIQEELQEVKQQLQQERESKMIEKNNHPRKASSGGSVLVDKVLEPLDALLQAWKARLNNNQTLEQDG